MEPDAFRQLPPVGTVLDHEQLASSVARPWPGRRAGRGSSGPRRSAVGAPRGHSRRCRSGQPGTPLARNPRRQRTSLRPVINATGILLHTGLGRAPLADEAIAAVTEVARGYCNLELDLEDGTRGRRTSGIAALLTRADRGRSRDGRQ